MEDRNSVYREFIGNLMSKNLTDSPYYPIEYFEKKYRRYLKWGFLLPPSCKRAWWVNRFWEWSRVIKTRGISQEECIFLLIKKNTQYSSKPLLLVGLSGITIRSMSKLIRIQNMGGQDSDAESIKDNLMDLYNYSILALLLLEEKLI